MTLHLVESFFIRQASQLVTSTTTSATTFSSLFVRRSKWDDLVDEDEEDEGFKLLNVVPDMRYEPHNIKRQLDHFLAIRQAGGKEMCNDIYVREPKSEIFWYAGKTARISDVSLEQCIARQWPLIEQHAANLRPIELFPSRGHLEIWTAPGDSELDVAYNRPTLVMQKQQRQVEGADKVKSNFVGFQGEVYQKGEEGFRTWRTDDGLPARPEINPGGETRPPTAEELAQLQQELQGRDIND